MSRWLKVTLVVLLALAVLPGTTAASATSVYDPHVQVGFSVRALTTSQVGGVVTTTARVGAFTYDAPALERVDGRESALLDGRSSLGGVGERFASRPAAARGAGTTPSRSFVATNTADDLAGAASRAASNVGPGSGSVYGTRVHSAFADEIAALGRSDLFSEVSYLNGQVVPYGTPGSVRLDVVVGSPSAPTAIWDLKTGSAALTPGRIAQIQSHLPPGFQNVPVLEVRP